MKDFLFESFPHILHGGDYNPDQWQHRPDILAEDMRLFRLANCNEMSIGIFAWSALEPEEGVYDFTFLDKALNDIYENGGRVLLATPSGARPAWLSAKYPEVLRWTQQYQQNHHGRRHNHCYTSPVYREKVAQINRRLAQRYGNHPAVLGWHISNEYGGKCYCPQCQDAFRAWLKNKYKTLEQLNEKWCMAFWSHTLTDWSQIDPPSPLGDMYVHGLTLDWNRFCSHQATDFMKAEIAAVKSVAPSLPVTTNFMGFHVDTDYFAMAKELDFASLDIYPFWRGNSAADTVVAKSSALKYDLTRSMKMRPWILMESTTTTTNWQPIAKLKRPGMHELASLQAIAHGSDSALYFQFRKAQGNTEKFHGAIVDHEGSENTRVFKEVAALGQRLQKLDCIVGTTVHAPIAILYDWSSRWALEDAQGFQRQDKKLRETVERFSGALWEKGINTDVISPDADFSPYRIILLPMLYAVSEETGRKLRAFVENGGTVVATYITAMTDEYDLCYLGGLPGAGLKEVFGIWNEEIDTLYPEEENTVTTADGEIFTAVDYCEVIHVRSAQVLATYQSDFYQGQPAATVNTFGKGTAYYIAFRDRQGFVEKILDLALAQAKVCSDFRGTLDKGVTVHSRTDGKTTYLFLQNFNYEPKTSTLQEAYRDLETSALLQGTVSLAPLETKILVKD